MDFDKEYKRLNPAQKQAVDQIDGPVMVIAGPGTGKTQLLAMRVANILKQTDADASSILCLTFTESAAANMTERMVQLFGAEAYRVAVHTFHGFGAEVINRHGQYFYDGALFRPSDDLTAIEVIEEILKNLPHSSPLASTMNGQFTYLNDVVSAISALKKSGLTPDEAEQVLNQNLRFADFVEPLLVETFARISKQTIADAPKILLKLEKYQEEPLSFTTELPLSQLFIRSLKRALDEADDVDTKPLTAWKKQWLKLDANKNLILTDRPRSEKMLELTKVYDQYLRRMSELGLYDFDDMILRVTHALEIFPELKYDLQERYQYILVDEFQDTNDAQMRLLRALTDYDPRPNIMVVGDDDQAIFRFQGADISNIQSFAAHYQNSKQMILSENYRSGKSILDLAERVAEQIDERLVDTLDTPKTLSPNVNETGKIDSVIAISAEHEYDHVAKQIARAVKAGTTPEQIAVIARRHADLVELLPFLADQNIDVEYEREQDVLSSEPVEQLELVARIVQYLSAQMHTEADELLPRLLAHPAWGVTPTEIWEISLAARAKRRYWLEIMLSFNDQTTAIAEWLIVMAARALNEPLEIMLDGLFGNYKLNNSKVNELASETNFISPLYDYFFAPENLSQNSTVYLEFLSSLTTLRQTMCDHRPGNKLLIGDFVALIDTYRSLGRTLTARRNYQIGGRVQLLTAHKAKGQEFDTVFIINASSQNWGEKARSRGSLLPFPHNMPFTLPGDRSDEQIRLIFVALTRARTKLVITGHSVDSSGRELLPVEYLMVNNLEPQALKTPTVANLTAQKALAWHAPITTPNTNLRELLADTLANYKLSATHLNNFVDVSDGGPTKFLMQNLLRFPAAKHPAAAFGSSIHTALQRAHLHLSARGDNKPLEDVISDFSAVLRQESLTDRDFEFYHRKGVDALMAFYNQRIDSFTPEQIVEREFGSENIVIDDVRLSGLVDLIDINKQTKTITVTDYKTGRPVRSWQGGSDYEKIKLRKYRQQLMFYKLLIENSREFAGYTVEKGVLEFVEPLDGKIVMLEMEYGREEMDEFVQLVKSVWQRIQALDLPNIDDFTPNITGVIDFEKFLIENS